MALESYSVTLTLADTVYPLSTNRGAAAVIISSPVTNSGQIRIFGSNAIAPITGTTPPSTGGFELFPGGMINIPYVGPPEPYNLSQIFASAATGGDKLSVIACII